MLVAAALLTIGAEGNRDRKSVCMSFHPFLSRTTVEYMQYKAGQGKRRGRGET